MNPFGYLEGELYGRLPFLGCIYYYYYYFRFCNYFLINLVNLEFNLYNSF